MFKKIVLLCIVCNAIATYAQQNATDSIPVLKPDSLKFNYKSLIIPGALIGYGVIGLESDWLKGFNSEIKEEVNENIDKKITIDDFTQYAPFVSVYGLNALGIKGKHNFKDRSIILGTSYLLMSGTVLSLKGITKVERPDGSSNNSFPSGHTATAFAGAEFLWQEYKDVSIWYGITGYAIATGTGLFRIYNDRHWLTDVAAGAGIGILSTKVAYWLHPYIKRTFFGEKETKSTVMMAPFYNGKQLGCGFVMNF
ncbi:MAG: phosphatase PAP2 family protein [Flavobacterium lindanitolerans]|uniref:phosphatase PAP2 family protein n=1 Tax=Flavobacterium lindanitolerans TaxID=428988 RepID=UPI001A640863|nr:phosphatase PAP2 family protein [Flavobacterium lindanitolerans]MBL7868684.1 phosphatase PAP2 family protein [Flavobacterium lindanitolerans]